MGIDIARPIGGTGLTTWGVGDYPLMAHPLEPAALAAVELAAAGPCDRVLARVGRPPCWRTGPDLTLT